jgi:hypothetical protein
MGKKVGILGKYHTASWGLLGLVLAWYRVCGGNACHVRIGWHSNSPLNSHLKRGGNLSMSVSFGLELTMVVAARTSD